MKGEKGGIYDHMYNPSPPAYLHATERSCNYRAASCISEQTKVDRLVVKVVKWGTMQNEVKLTTLLAISSKRAQHRQ